MLFVLSKVVKMKVFVLQVTPRQIPNVIHTSWNTALFNSFSSLYIVITSRYRYWYWSYQYCYVCCSLTNTGFLKIHGNNDICKTDFSVGLYRLQYIYKLFTWLESNVNSFNKQKTWCLCNSASRLCDLFQHQSDVWPLVQLWPQQHSNHYSCNLYLSKFSAPLPLIMSQCDESGWSHHHADLVFILNICCVHFRRTNSLFVIRALTWMPLDVKDWNIAQNQCFPLSPLCSPQ